MEFCGILTKGCSSIQCPVWPQSEQTHFHSTKLSWTWFQYLERSYAVLGGRRLGLGTTAFLACFLLPWQNTDQEQLRKETVSFISQLSGHSLSLREAKAGTWSGNWTRDHGEALLTGIFLVACSVIFIIQPRDGSAHSWAVSLSHRSMIRKMALQTRPRAADRSSLVLSVSLFSGMCRFVSNWQKPCQLTWQVIQKL